jgi:hypothetical protein
MRQELNFQVSSLCPGRALYVGKNDELYVARSYRIFRSDDWGRTWRLDCFVPSKGWKPLAAKLRLAARLLRYDIAAFEVLPDGTRIAVARDGLYRAEPGALEMTRVFRITRGSRPLNVTVDGARVLFGEYGDGYQNSEVFIYVSEDGGRTFDIGYRFPTGSIRHVHGIQLDPYRDVYWLLVGDYGRQPGIGTLSKDLRNVEWLSRGSQLCRVVRAMIEPDRLTYGTDSDVEQNFIVAMNKDSGKITKLRQVEGASIFATRFGPVSVISTCVEPNLACPGRNCSLYVSWDGFDWRRGPVHRKDWHNPVRFQFGTLVLPYAYNSRPRGMFSGQALQLEDNRVSLVEFDADAG